MSKVRYVIERQFKIHDKSGTLVPFHLNNIQADFDEKVIEAGVKRSSIVKFRQGGCTSIIMAWFLVECMNKFARCVMLAHDRDHTEKLLRRAQLFLKNLNGPPPEITRMNENEIIFKRTDASFYIGTAGSKLFGRSDTITHLHCSEVAFWKDPKTLLAGLMQAVPHDTGIVVKESTGNGWGTWHQRDFYRSLAGETRDVPIFYGWYLFDEYESKTPPQTDLDEDELKLYAFLEEKGYTEEKILKKLQWRREKIDEFNNDVAIFKQEYPTVIEDAFKLTGGALLAPALTTEPRWHVLREEGRLEGHPNPSYHYSLGADCSGGTGNDYSAININCLETQEQVYRWRSNTSDPVKFARVIASKGKWFNEALLVVERNSHGISALSILRELYSKTKIYKQPTSAKTVSAPKLEVPALQYGWLTRDTTKAYLIGITTQFLLDGLKIYDPLTYDELLGFSEDAETGAIISTGDNDDLGVAFMLSCIGLLKLRRTYAESLFAAPAQKQLDVTWRDSEGKYLLRFEDIISPREKKNDWSNFTERSLN
ncbi:MAG: hypothetical protein DDT19_02412 [Syntrophomonadaceae bacterium]|nr:hypothetical protein [Bacillota bacterium]